MRSRAATSLGLVCVAMCSAWCLRVWTAGPMGVAIFPCRAATASTRRIQTSNTVSVIDPFTNKLLGVIRLGDPCRPHSARCKSASYWSTAWATRQTERCWPSCPLPRTRWR
jgi:DNA-binding beta-propeller fold protein YncE